MNKNSSFLFGEGIFRTLKVVNGKILHWQDHMQKLKEDCLFLSLPLPFFTEEELQEIIVSNNAAKGTWRLKIIIADSFSTVLEPYQFCKTVKSLTVFPQTVERPSAKIKSLSYLDNRLVLKYAQANGFDDALMLDHNKTLLECSHANFLWFHNGILHFSEPSLPYYEGVTQKRILAIALQLGFKVKPCCLKVGDLPESANLFTANAMQGLIPVTQISEKAFSRNFELELALI